VQTEFGPFRWSPIAMHSRGLHFALVRGTLSMTAPPCFRACMCATRLSDVLHLQRDDLGLTVTSALRRIADEDRGVLLVLSGEDTPEALLRTPQSPAQHAGAGRSAAAGMASAWDWARRYWPIWACIACVCSARREKAGGPGIGFGLEVSWSAIRAITI
jgi:GTP cyclohydrolase II